MSLLSLLDFKEIADTRGTLVALEGGKNIPFEIRRIYYLFGTNASVRRGLHAHKELRQVACCVSGSCTMLLDDGKQKQEVKLEGPAKGVMIEPLVWHEMFDFSEDCVLLVLASDYYDESDYIRSYDEFESVVR